MPVTELALLRLKSPERPLSPAAKAALHHAQKAQTEFSGYQLHFLRQCEDPAYFYVLGGWESIEKHNEEWIPGETNQRLLKQLEDEVTVMWMFHIDMDPSTSIIPFDAPIITIARHWVDSNKKDEFERVFRSESHHLGKHTAPFTYCGGWRIIQAGQAEEFVVFNGWNTVEDCTRFPESDAFKEYGKITLVHKVMQIRHARLEKWE